MKIKRIILLGSLAAIALCGSKAVSFLGDTSMHKTLASQSIETDQVVYELSDYIKESINTFACWIKLPSSLTDNEVGGVIMGNHFYASMYKGTNNFSIGKEGHFTLFWNTNKYNHIFEGYDLRNDAWTHIALVRDKENKTLSYYVNGVLNETISDIELPESFAHHKYRIGMDQANWYLDLFNQVASPFKGEIKQVSLFNKPLSEEDILSLKDKETITKEDFDSVLTNICFSNWGNEKIMEDTSGQINATRVTFNKAVPVKETGEFDYSFIVVPDMQAMNNNNPSNWFKQSKWIVENKDALKTKFVMYMGDMVEAKYSVNPEICEEQWANAQEFMTMLDDEVPYTFVLGNHDYDNWAQSSRATTKFNEYFPYSKYSEFSYFGGAYEKGCMDNTYSLIKVGDIEYLIFALEEGVRDRVLNWVGRTIESHPRSRVLITTHAYINGAGEVGDATKEGGIPSKTITYDNCNNADQMWAKCFSKYPNVMGIFCGHECADDIRIVEQKGKYGNHVYSILTDLQGSIGTCAMNTVLLVKVNEKNKTMDLCYYWIDANACFNEQSQFQLSFGDKFNPTVGK